MFKSYLKLALRNLWKRKTTTAINVLGLSIGLACCALVFLFFQHDISFDKGFDNSNDIYRITTNFNDGGKAPTVSMPYVTYLKSEIPEIDEASRLDASKCTCIVQVKDSSASTPFTVDNGYWVDPSFFNIFSFHFLQGERKTALLAPNTIVISAPLAQKLFGDKYPIGKPLKAGDNIYTITGVFKNDFTNHFGADFFASNNSNGVHESIAAKINWVTDPNYYAYIKLKPGSNKQHVISELNAYTQRHAGPDLKSTATKLSNSLQALLDIHLHSSAYQSYLEAKQGNLSYLYLLGSIALAILLLGCINYMNLSTAQAVDRSREVGVRRVMGAGKSSIRYQFMIETIAISVLALMVAIGLGFLFLPAFNNLTGQSLSFFAPENRSLILWLLLISLFTGLLAGLYPALYLSAFKPVKVLKGKVSDSAGMFNLRKVLVSVQFIISTCLVFATIVIWNQLHFMINSKPGFDQDQQLTIYFSGNQSTNSNAYFISQLAGNPNFQSVTGATAPLISGDMNFYPAEKTVNDKHDVFLDFADENYIKTLNLKFISGGNFSAAIFGKSDPAKDMEVSDIGREIVLNEQAVKQYGLNPYTAPGHYISHLRDGKIYTYKIVGVVKDYHFFSLHSAIGPIGIIAANPNRFTTVIAKIKGKNAPASIKFIAQKWKEIYPDVPFNYGFMNKAFSYDYDQDAHQQQMMGAFAVIAILISCLGILGLITYTLSQKAREIGIRKVIGASVTNIVMLFYSQYFKLVLIANVIALPLAWYYMSKWLNGFAYRINMSWWMFAASLSAGVIIAFCTIAFKTIKAASANPVKSLKAE
ncbi:putative ABC transport system permease protein [Mucilaginibacter mallensis]|uniref:Putative ABC transport system permease protein n=1 Tax=Mucilaginibacter mallensis TaxID=652787 RepID=A0A1H2C233_MUCMA|nr:ABC transporter permease [Mucilaginibacter mallensis]SDT64473.1 putative ABC transport system permease protein [Mucilaginibacter mallensis]